MTDLPLPANIGAEKTILGAIILDPSAMAEADGKIEADDFALDSHQRIFTRMQELSRNRIGIDIVTLSNELARHKEIESVGGVAYLAELTEGLPLRPVIDEYIRIVKDRGLLRRLMAICSQAIARAADQSETALEVLGAIQMQLGDVEASRSASFDLESVGQWIAKNDVFAERKAGIFSGLDDYDDLTWGFQDEELTVIAGRTSMGKSAHACSLTWKMAKRGVCVGLFINEQRKKSFLGRMLCARSGVSFKTYQRGTYSMVERSYLEDALHEFRTLPIFWDYAPGMTMASVRAKARKLKRTGELDIIIIDQLSGISNEGFWEKGKRYDLIIGDKAMAAKNLAQELKVPVVLYHQLGRGTLKNKDSRPTLADLQESGKIEQHADNVDFLHRPKYYERDSTDDDEIIRAKSRDGEVGTVKCEFKPWCCYWTNKS